MTWHGVASTHAVWVGVGVCAVCATRTHHKDPTPTPRSSVRKILRLLPTCYPSLHILATPTPTPTHPQLHQVAVTTYHLAVYSANQALVFDALCILKAVGAWTAITPQVLLDLAVHFPNMAEQFLRMMSLGG